MNIRKIARTFAQRFVAEYELMEEGLPVLIAVEALIHTDESPYCNDPSCPCQNAWQQLQAIPSYVERLARGEEPFGE